MNKASAPAQVMPIVAVGSVDATRDFYVEKLGFDHQMAVVGNDGELDFCTVDRGGGKIMFSRSETMEAATPSAQFYFQVDDVDAYHQQLKANGVEGTDPEDMWWGDRVFIVTDLNGYKLWFNQTVSQPAPPPGMKVV
jgi:uncharacterized glyoxalase superfamily protein PhnB